MKESSKLAIAVFVAVLLVAVFLRSSPGRNPITGNAAGTAVVSFGILPACSVVVKSGWNFVSVCANLSDYSVQSALSSINGLYRYVMFWNATAQSFEIYSPLSSQNPFTQLDPYRGYFIYYVGNDTYIQFGGPEYDFVNVSSAYGWDTPFYPFTFSIFVTNLTDLIPNQLRYLLEWNTSSESFAIYSPLSSQNPFDTIDAGEGIFLYVTNASGAVISYNKTLLQ